MSAPHAIAKPSAENDESGLEEALSGLEKELATFRATLPRAGFTLLRHRVPLG
ncbi:hypothetical protein [Streptomyces sp. NBC_00829]|uniref:hypothetical protein n=1 Tax=Streptomyces sp. NBC_00829 TaxID=2903679 RepID=UPI00386D11A0|nr:hypothetical protein OG293_01060 [Streptomyces sp. NBC_00829]